MVSSKKPRIYWDSVRVSLLAKTVAFYEPFKSTPNESNWAKWVKIAKALSELPEFDSIKPLVAKSRYTKLIAGYCRDGGSKFKFDQDTIDALDLCVVHENSRSKTKKYKIKKVKKEDDDVEIVYDSFEERQTKRKKKNGKRSERKRKIQEDAEVDGKIRLDFKDKKLDIENKKLDNERLKLGLEKSQLENDKCIFEFVRPLLVGLVRPPTQCSDFLKRRDESQSQVDEY